MIFKTSESSAPIAGTTRTKVRFAWLPKKIGSAMVWLESYEILECYIVTEHKAIVEGVWMGVSIRGWQKISERFIKWKRVDNE